MSPSEHNIRDLYEYCATRGITIYPSIRPKHVPGYGLGVYSTEAIASDTQLVQIPVSEIFTTDNIPQGFLSRTAREGIAVHAQLAAFFAFGEEADLEQYDAWIATWPAFDDFFETMPLFWGDLLADLLEERTRRGGKDSMNQSGPAAKKQKTMDGSNPHDSDALTSRMDANGSGKRDWAMNLQSLGIIRSQAVQMAQKLVSHVYSIHVALPGLEIMKDPKKLTKFFHAWCLINTRCFYYVPSLSSRTKQKAPEDPNEAMGMCPFMDLFNHAAPSDGLDIPGADGTSPQKPCKVSSGMEGFTAITKSQVSANKEILFSYGPHTNDTLWSEYGFLLPGSGNSSDSVLLDQIVLRHITKEQIQALEEHDYLASYTLFNDGSVCYRTEMVAWLLVLGTSKWMTSVGEGLDPADLVEADEFTVDNDQQQQRNGTRSRPFLSPARRHQQIIEGWLTTLQEQAQENVVVLQSMTDAEVLETYKTMSIISSTLEERSAEGKVTLARRRQKMCSDRCEQISAMAARGVEASISGSIEEVSK